MSRTVLDPRELPSRVGQELGVSPWLEIDQARIDAFAHSTGDLQWIHVDPEKARASSPYKTTIAHGYLTLSLIPGLAGQTLEWVNRRMGVNYGVNRVRFPAPVPVGSRVRARFKLAQCEAFEGGVQATMDVTMEREGQDKPVMAAQLLSRHYF